MTPLLRKYEETLVDLIRAGDREAWADLLALYIPRVHDLSCRWRIDEQDVYDVVIAKVEYAIPNYRVGGASFWGYVRILVDRALTDYKRKAINSRKVHLSTIVESDEHGYSGRLSVEQSSEDVEFIYSWIQPHRSLCAELIYPTSANVECQACFREFLNVRRGQRLITKRSMFNVLATFHMPDPQGKRILQMPLFADGFATTLIDDYTLLGERILKSMATGVSYSHIGGKIGESQMLVNRYKRHWKQVAAIVASGYEPSNLVA